MSTKKAIKSFEFIMPETCAQKPFKNFRTHVRKHVDMSNWSLLTPCTDKIKGKHLRNSYMGECLSS